jgi:hypothetical protein
MNFCEKFLDVEHVVVEIFDVYLNIVAKLNKFVCCNNLNSLSKSTSSGGGHT